MADQTIAITLPDSAWNTVLQALGAQPYQAVAEVIQAVQQQAQQQIEARASEAE